MEEGSVVIFETEHLIVEHFPNRSQIAAFTFSSWQPPHLRSKEGMGFGGGFLQRHGFDVIAFKSVRNWWFQDVDDATFDAVERFVPPMPRVGYGSSMGAYAAITFAKLLKLDRVLALSPQFHPLLDHRWPDALEIPFTHRIERSPGTRTCVVYDPRNPDGRHVKEIRKAAGPIEEVRVPFSGHPVTHLLHEADALQSVALSFLRDAEIPDVDRRALRLLSPSYFFTLSTLAAKRQRNALALALCERAIELKPTGPWVGHRENLLRRLKRSSAERDPALR